MKFAGGRDPGPLNPPSAEEEEPGAIEQEAQAPQEQPQGQLPSPAEGQKQPGPWNVPLPTGAARRTLGRAAGLTIGADA